MKNKLLTILAMGLLAGPMAANAVVVTVEGNQWNVTTQFLDIVSDRSTLTSQVWFDNFSLAVLFKNAVGDSLGTPESFFFVDTGPFFAYGFYTNNSGEYASIVMNGYGYCDVEGNCGFGSAAVFAVASRVATVPEPGTLALLGLGLAGLGLARRRKQD